MQVLLELRPILTLFPGRIAFSNERYYDRGLLTFPSNSSEGLGVSSRYVPDGVYDKGRTRTNAVEARAVVAEVVRRLRDADEQRRSIGVVTFSQAQQTLCFAPETSGGLLMAVPADRVDQIMGQLTNAWLVGEVVTTDEPSIQVVAS